MDETVTSWLLAGRNYDLTQMADPLADLFIRGFREQSSLAVSCQQKGRKLA
jgi:hypothetical protein